MRTLQRYSFLFFFFSSLLLNAQSYDSLLKRFVTNKSFSGAKISILAVDLSSFDTLMSYNPILPTATASTTKLFSTAMALELLGPDYRFETTLFTDGLIEQGVLKGNLWIKGGGDVSFGSKYFNGEGKEYEEMDAWIDSLKKLGIHEIQGKVIVDGSSFGYEGTPSGWSAWDAGNYFGAFPAGLNFYDNVARYYFETGKPGSRARLISTSPVQPNLQLINKITSASVKGDHSNLQGRAYDEHRIATGKLPAYQSSYMVRGSVANPEFNFAEVLKSRFLLDSFTVSGGVLPVRGIPIPDYDCFYRLFATYGRSVQEITKWTNRKSVNLFAEGLLNGVAFKLTGDGSNSNARKIYNEFFASRIDTLGLRLYDGSGLSRNNRITAAHFCDLLNYMTQSPMADEFFNSLPVAGKSGTIIELCKGAAGDGRIYAKSGTMTGIKSYAGYINTLSGKKLAFAFVVNGYSCSQSTVKQQMEILLNHLAQE
jgi:D-alanyl-D-alanine carboxypeptidase/D-alanyl-D-alanine-endopeptidase (penicillin-binding protein 4)